MVIKIGLSAVAVVLAALAVQVDYATIQDVKPSEIKINQNSINSESAIVKHDEVEAVLQNSAELSEWLEGVWAEESGEGIVPRVAVMSLPDDMGALDVAGKKRTFFRMVLPHVLEENDRLLDERRFVEEARSKLAGGTVLDEAESRRLAGLAALYRVKGWKKMLGAEAGELASRLLEKVDAIPPSLALAQAAIESGWGTSRFARLGNNLFGQWRFDGKGGIVPEGRAEGATYTVADYADLGESVAAYMKNLNTLWAYEDLRTARAALRSRGARPDGWTLASGLLRYSERKEAYVEEVRAIIKSNGLSSFDAAKLSRSRRVEVAMEMKTGGRSDV